MKRCITLTFPSELIAEPVIYNLGMQFGVVTTIQRANVTEDMGWVMLEMEGEEKDIEEGIAWIIGKGIKVESADDCREDSSPLPPLTGLP